MLLSGRTSVPWEKGDLKSLLVEALSRLGGLLTLHPFLKYPYLRNNFLLEDDTSLKPFITNEIVWNYS
jgi:hypothetical protein